MCTLYFCRRYSNFSRAVSHLRNTSEQLTGHSDVVLAQQLVKEKKEELRRFRHELSEAVASYEDVQKKLKSLYARKTQVYQDQKRDISTLQAINNEEEALLYQEQKLHSNLEQLKSQERECFESLSDGIQISHEKERAQSDRLKYYSRLGSILGAFLGFLSSNFFLRREIRKHNVAQSERLSSVERSLLSLTKPVAANRDDSLSVSSSEEISLVRNVQERLQSTEAVVQEVSTKVARNSQMLEILVASRKQAVDIPRKRRVAAKEEEERERVIHSKSSLQDRNVLLGVVIYSVGLALLAFKN